MERNFTDENFERFLRQNADGLRMRPSDKVWASINSRLNRRRRRFGFLLGFSLLATAGLGYYLTGNPASSTATASHPTANKGKTASDHHSQSLAIANGTAATGITPSQAGEGHQGNSLIVVHNRRNTGEYASALVNFPAGRQLTDASPAASFTLAATGPVPEAFQPTIVDSYEEGSLTEEKKADNAVKPATDPLTIESVLNSYRPRTGKVGFEVYFTPTFSYRKLHDNNVNNVVTHKPDFGFEIGLSAKYPIARNLKVIGGLQFNVNRYDIKTYNSTPQYATIRLRNGMDSLSASTSYNNFGGYKSNWLENFFFQISAPVGFELRLKGNSRTQFGIATTIQPTYVLGDRAYLISSDYKNYAEVPRLISRWNMNTSLATFVSYGTGHLKWQVGPQVRYQLYSTYDRKYPVKENLFDFGLKVGISLNNR